MTMTLVPVQEGTKTMTVMKSLLERHELSVLDAEDTVIELQRLFENGRFRDKYLLWAVNDSFTCEEIFSIGFTDESIENGLEEAQTRQHNCERITKACDVLRAVFSQYPEHISAAMCAVGAYLLWWHRQYGLAAEYAEAAYKRDPDQSLAILMHQIVTCEIPSPNTSVCEG